jgi:hypothetical protein
MPDVLKDTKVEHDEVDLNDRADVRRWCDELGVDEDRLRDLVRSVGNNTIAIRSYLKGR